MNKKKRDKFLAHYGVPGMKWGHHTSGSSKGSKKSKKPKLQKKRMSEMSNEELKNFNTRMNLEKQYRKLSKSKVDVGRRVFNNIVLNSAQVVATAYVVNRFKRVVH